MAGLLAVFEILVQLFSCWTVAYHLCLLCRFPAWFSLLLCCLLYLPFAVRVLPKQVRLLRGLKPNSLLGMLLLLSLLCGSLTLFISRPDADDFSFFHRVVAQLPYLDRPFFLTHTGENVSGLPPQSFLHVSTSYEPLMGMLAVLFHLSPLHVYQNLSAFFAAGLLPLAYFLLYREFRMPARIALAATVLALVFLLGDGNTHRAFGNVGLVRLWQGKTILWTLVLPLTLLFGWRFLRRPSTYRWMLVAMTALCGVGLSNSGTYLLPVLLAAMAAAYYASYGFTRRRLRRACLLLGAALYPALVSVAVLIGLIPKPSDVGIYTFLLPWPTDWRENLDMVIGGNRGAVRDLLLLALPVTALKKPLHRYPVSISLGILILCINPIVAPFWMRTIFPASYWRLLYLLPLPWCSGLLAGILCRSFGNRRLAVGFAVFAIFSLLFSYRSSVLASTNEITWKSPGELKLPLQELAFLRSAAPYLHARNLLAPENVAMTAALLDPTIRLECGRQFETVHVFSNAGQKYEGLRRADAQNLVTAGRNSSQERAAFACSIQHGVDAVVLTQRAFHALPGLMLSVPGRWMEAIEDSGYVLFLKESAWH